MHSSLAGKRSILMVMVLSLMTLQCGSDDDDGGNGTLVCNASLLAGGRYTMTVTSVGNGCFQDFQSIIETFFNGTQFVLPGYQDLPVQDFSINLLDLTVTADIAVAGDHIEVTDVSPNPIPILGATVTVYSVTACPISNNDVVVTLDIEVDHPLLPEPCRDVVQASGALSPAQ